MLYKVKAKMLVKSESGDQLVTSMIYASVPQIPSVDPKTEAINVAKANAATFWSLCDAEVTFLETSAASVWIGKKTDNS